MASLREICPLCTAFDRLHYMKIFPQHFGEVLCMPKAIRDCFVRGGFVCNIRGTKIHAVALDEAHENKDIKTSIVRPYPTRSKVCKQLKEQLSLPSLQEKAVSILTILLVERAVRKIY